MPSERSETRASATKISAAARVADGRVRERLEAVREDVAGDREVERPEDDRREQHQLDARGRRTGRRTWRSTRYASAAWPSPARDIDALVGPATPHFAYQLRARVRELIEDLPADHPVRRYGEEKMRCSTPRPRVLEGRGRRRESRARPGWEQIPSSAPASEPLPPRT